MKIIICLKYESLGGIIIYSVWSCETLNRSLLYCITILQLCLSHLKTLHICLSHAYLCLCQICVPYIYVQIIFYFIVKPYREGIMLYLIELLSLLIVLRIRIKYSFPLIWLRFFLFSQK